MSEEINEFPENIRDKFVTAFELNRSDFTDTQVCSRFRNISVPSDKILMASTAAGMSAGEFLRNMRNAVALDER